MRAQKQKGNFVIYGLICPKDLSVKYIGCTSYIITRYAGHIKTTKNPKRKKDVWINDLIVCGLKPLLVIIKEFKNHIEATLYEQEIIYKFRNQLLNARCIHRSIKIAS